MRKTQINTTVKRKIAIIGTMNCLHGSLSNIYQRGIVNNIIGAFFIKELQDKIKNNEKKKVPISTFELGE